MLWRRPHVLSTDEDAEEAGESGTLYEMKRGLKAVNEAGEDVHTGAEDVVKETAIAIENAETFASRVVLRCVQVVLTVAAVIWTYTLFAMACLFLTFIFALACLSLAFIFEIVWALKGEPEDMTYRGVLILAVVQQWLDFLCSCVNIVNPLISVYNGVLQYVVQPTIFIFMETLSCLLLADLLAMPNALGFGGRPTHDAFYNMTEVGEVFLNTTLAHPLKS